MATAMTYSSLLTDVRRYLERGFTLASDQIVYEQLPRLINLAEHNLAVKLKIQGFINVVSGSMQMGLAVYPKPDRWRKTVSINFGSGLEFQSYNQLFSRDYEYCRMYWPNRNDVGVPEFYADYNYNNWLITPTPDLAYPFEALVYQLPPLLDEFNQQNWVTEYAPQLILYGTLLEATPFLKNDERIPTWQNMYNDALSAINGEDIQKILDRSAVRERA